MRIIPRAGVDRAAPQPDENRYVLDANGALKLARTTGSALECRLLRYVFAQQRLVGCGSELIQVTAHAQNNFLRVEFLARVVGRAVLRAAAAFHAGISLQTHNLRQILSRHQPEILIAAQGRDLREDAARKEHAERA